MYPAFMKALLPICIRMYPAFMKALLIRNRKGAATWYFKPLLCFLRYFANIQHLSAGEYCFVTIVCLYTDHLYNRCFDIFVRRSSV